ncbi:hypothetical protein HU200_061155 [Digitaria exilis]|uniref:Reverse transcriptase zinc-binding domain-containing protein n=1 Tax=Digitaria exilis TaxID=1010633 RepID=A0A835A7S8_9POAL|nr:hypothetical protein HU200_061155 [Digitaria exilis]
MFYASTSMQIGGGRTTLFWTDRWLNDSSITELARCLMQAVGPRIQKRWTVREALHNRQWARDITGALTVQVILEYLQIWELVQQVHLDDDLPDRVLWRWTADQQFTTASAYQAFFQGQYSTPGVKVLWKARAPNKCRFFLWLGLHDLVWIADRHKRHGLQPTDTCILCQNESETITHLFISCSYSRATWSVVLSAIGCQSLTPPSNQQQLQWLTGGLLPGNGGRWSNARCLTP